MERGREQGGAPSGSRIDARQECCAAFASPVLRLHALRQLRGRDHRRQRRLWAAPVRMSPALEECTRSSTSLPPSRLAQERRRPCATRSSASRRECF